MPVGDIHQTNFTGGELSPKLSAHVDFEKYQDGLELCQNFIVNPQGGVIRRGGTGFAAEARDSTQKSRLIPFVASAANNYMLEFADQWIRFYQDNIQVQNAQGTVSTALFTGGDAVVTIGAHTYETGSTIVVAGITPSGYNGTFVLTDVDPDRIRYAVGADPGAYVSGGTADGVLEIASPYLEAQLPPIKEAQSADTMYLSHNLHGPRKLIRHSATDWSINQITFLDGPYLNENVSETTLQPSAVSGTSVITLAGAAITSITRVLQIATVTTTLAHNLRTGDRVTIVGAVETEYNRSNAEITVTSATVFTYVVTGAPTTPATGTITLRIFEFVATDVGRSIRIRNSAVWGYGIITVFTDAVTVTVETRRDFTATTATNRWQLGAWSDTTGFPRAVSLFQNRLFFGGNTFQPSTWWASVSGDFENMQPNDETSEAVTADDAVVITLTSQQVNTIIWMVDGRFLLIGASEQVFSAQGGDTTKAITATSVPEIRNAAYFGADGTVRPVRIGDDVLYVQGSARKVRAINFNFDSDGFQADDVTLLADHIGLTGIVDATYQDTPNSVYWGVRVDGVLIGVTFNRAQKIAAWHRHIPGGVFGTGNAIVETVGVISTATHDQVWVIVKRTINSVTRRFVEFMEREYEDTTIARNDAHLVDSGIRFSGGAPATIITGLTHLEGETVEVYADGATQPSKVVVSGQITIELAAFTVIAGLGNVARIRTLPLAAGERIQGIQGKTKKLTHAAIRFLDTGALRFGSDLTDLRELVFRKASDPTGAAVPLFTGTKVEGWPGARDIDAQGYFQSDGPQPCHILGVGFHFDVADRP